MNYIDLRDFPRLHPDAVILLSVKDLKIKPSLDMTFTDTDGRSRDQRPYMTAKEKMTIYKKWIAFLNSHFKRRPFHKALYQHLSTHCRFIAHHDIHGFYQTYFESPHMFHAAVDKKGKGTEEAKRWWAQIYEDLAFGEERYDQGLSAFYHNWTTLPSYYYQGDYGDLVGAMADVFERYVDLWVDIVERTNAKLESIKEAPGIKTRQDQRERLQQSIADANTELFSIEQELFVEIHESTKRPQKRTSVEDTPSLFDLFDDDVA